MTKQQIVGRVRCRWLAGKETALSRNELFFELLCILGHNLFASALQDSHARRFQLNNYPGRRPRRNKRVSREELW